MFKRFIVILFLAAAASAAAASPAVTLPDNGVYYYWVRSASGSIIQAPKISKGTSEIDISSNVPVSGDLYILDSHTGYIADVPITKTAKSVSLSVDQFHAIAPSAPPAPPSPTPAPSTAPVQAQAPAPQPAPSVLSRVVTFVLGAVVLGAVVWLIRSLVLTRGQLLVDTARKMGVDVPNPGDLPATEVEREGKYEPPPPVRVQRIPDEAFKPPLQPSGAGYLTTQDGTAYGIGGKVLSIGRDAENDIVLSDNSVSRRHARIQSNGDTVEIHDEQSANGVFVNGERIETHILRPGDYLHIGRVPMKYEK